MPETGSVEAYGDRVIVRRIPPDEKVGSIFIPEDASRVGQHSHKTRLCEVVSVGHKRLKNGTKVPLSVSPGDRILMSIYKGKEFPVVGEELVAIHEEDILCVVGASDPAPDFPDWLPAGDREIIMAVIAAFPFPCKAEWQEFHFGRDLRMDVWNGLHGDYRRTAAVRWRTGTSDPTTTPGAVIAALREQLDRSVNKPSEEN